MPDDAIFRPTRWTVMGKIRVCAIALALGWIFYVAARGRFSLPVDPVMDPDSLGYINPLLTWLSGKGFCQADGRSAPYPLFLWATTLLAGSFSAVTVIQHVAGLLSGVAWWWTWSVWVSFLPHGTIRRWVAPAFGLASLAICLWGTRTILFEHTIRPEAIFPTVGILQIGVCLAFIRARWLDRNALASSVYAGCAIVLAALAMNLKPSWGFAAGLPLLLIGMGVWKSGPDTRRGLAVAAVVGLAVATLPSVVIPTAIGWQSDLRSKTFLAETLASVHAKMISSMLTEKSERGLLTPEEDRFAADFAKTVQEAVANNQSFPVLGVECDQIYYRSGIFSRLPNGASDSPETLRKYLIGLYVQSLLARPADYLKKWSDQFALACWIPAKEIFRTKYRVRLSYEYTLATWRIGSSVGLPEPWRTRWDRYADRCRQLAGTGPMEVHPTSAVPAFLPQLMAASVPASLLILPGFFLGCLACWRRGAGRLVAYGPAAEARNVARTT